MDGFPDLTVMRFGLSRCVAGSRSGIGINVDGVFLTKELGPGSRFGRMPPYPITPALLAFASTKARAFKGEGIPCDIGQR